MCEWCMGPAGALPEAAFVERPAQRLVGRYWEGTHEAAAAGATVALLSSVRAEIAAAGGWGGPIVSISWATGAGRFRTFVGVEAESETGTVAGDAREAPGLETLELAPMRFVSDWHDETDGEVIDHYQSMLEWMRLSGAHWDKSRLHHREEYPRHADFSAPPVLRLMLPVASEQGGTG